ncbi:MAG: hypothetical protein ACFFG0_05570 [Candidatus Thorarchaeota archaeon]
MHDKLQTFGEDKIVCPYCGSKEDDPYNYHEDCGIIECPDCEKKFHYERHILITYSTDGDNLKE